MELVSVPVAAKELGISPQTIRRAIEDGELAAFRIGSRWVRVERGALRAWVMAKRMPSGGGGGASEH